MLIGEAGKASGLTRKAIEYYMEQGLVFPKSLENSYRDFSEDDLELLKKISIYRKLGISTEDIKAVLADETGNTLQKISVRKELDIQREKARQAILNQLNAGKSFTEIEETLIAIEQGKTVTDKILESFPGYYGRFMCLHFGRFLNEPVSTPGQQAAYDQIIEFLDSAPGFEFPKELQDFLDENTRDISVLNIQELNEHTRQAVENMEEFLSENNEALTRYLEYRNSDEYINSPIYRVQTMLGEFNETSGYYDVFIPALKKLSPSYASYCDQLEAANKKLLVQYPEIEGLKNKSKNKLAEKPEAGL